MLKEANDADDGMLIKDYSHYRVKLRCSFVKFTIDNYVTLIKILSCSNFFSFVFAFVCMFNPLWH